MDENTTMTLTQSGCRGGCGRTRGRRGRPGRADSVRRLRPADACCSTSSAPAAPSSGAGQTKSLDPDDPGGSNANLDEQDWSGQLAGQVEAMGEAWSRPAAWTGTVEGAQMPAPAIGELGLIEVLLHGWDVARATGQPLSVSEELGAELLRCLEPTLEQGRQFDVYGPEVSVPSDAPAFTRALGLSGRDPDWKP